MSLLVVIPCLNEGTHLPQLLAWLGEDSVASQIVVVDGGSIDGSESIVRAAGERDARIALMHNPKRLQSAAVNLAVRTFGDKHPLLVRLDAHANYPKDYLTQLLAAKEESRADCVVVSMRAVAAPGACFQRAAACAQNSALGSGGSPHRKPGQRRWVDHGHHALFDTAMFLAAGGYDEAFSHNEDAELDARLTGQGARILLAADIVIDYFPRSTASALARQYYMYGRGRARTVLKHRRALKPRQLAPVLVAPAIAAAIAIGPFFPIAAAPAVLWLGASLLYGLLLGVRERSPCACAAGAAASIMHAAWSIGFLRQTAFDRGPSAPTRLARAAEPSEAPPR
jgi:succinoglycan biosynthesis protein ExoA